ncbi:MAG: hypothetical protein JWN33_108 [Candidatus Saccharibacteria bacterium]|nr:hypothetical protein [Candidatus Saccharibacteria bacterium]
MPRIHRKLTRLARRSLDWSLDYQYVAWRQLVGFLRPTKLVKQGKGEREVSVLLIPGVYESWQFMRPIADVCTEAGYDVHVVDQLGYNRGSIEAMSEVVRRYITEQGLKRCVIVAHSKGGLIGKYLLAQQNEGGEIRGLIAINSPFAGSIYAYLMPVKSLRIFLPHSPLIARLAANREVNDRIISIYSSFDPHIPGGSYLEGAQNIELSISGHFKPVNDKAVHQAVIEGIKKLSAN